MSEINHTPGPWSVDMDRDDYPVIGHPEWKCRRFGVEGEWEIASVEDLGEEHDEERAANASLISAAPDLLAALKALFKDFKELADSGDAGFWKIEDQQVGKDALAAIAKATGATPNTGYERE